MPRQSTIDLLTPELRARLQALLATPGVTQQQIADTINQEAGGVVVSKSAVNRYHVAMRKFATKNRQAREVVEAYLAHAGAEGQQQLSEVLVHQLRTITFDLMIEIQEVQESEPDDPERIHRIAELLGRVARSVRETEQAADRSAERRRRLRQEVAEAAAAEASAAAQEAGLSAGTVAAIRERILGVAA